MNRSRDRSLHLHFARLYLFIIGLLCVFLLIISTVSLLHQRDVARSYSLKDMRLDGDRLAVELQRRTWQLAEESLADPELRRLVPEFAGPRRPDDMLEARFAKAGSKHPIARFLIVLHNGHLSYPSQTSPSAGRRFPDPGNTLAEQQFSAVFQEAEANVVRKMYGQAIDGYSRCSTMAVAGSWKAEAIRRLAACYAKTSQPTPAVRAYDRVARDYGDLLDNSYQPYAVIAALEVTPLLPNRVDQDKRLQAVYRDLLQGRWQLSFEVTERFRRELEKRLGVKQLQEKSRYLAQFKSAADTETDLRREMSEHVNEIFSYVVENGGPAQQVFGVVIPDRSGRNLLLAFSTDLDWVGGSLLSECRKGLVTNEGPIPAFELRLKDPATPSDLKLGFGPIFPFLELHLPPAAVGASKMAIRIELWLAGGSAVLMACLLYVVVILILRVSRQINLLQMRTDFLSHVSHELKTPLTMILLYCETLLADEQLDYQKRRGCYQVIAREGERLKRLIGNLLNLSRLEKAKLDYRIVEGDMAAVVEKTTRACEGWLDSMGFEVSIDLAPDLPPVRFDSERVSQALMNLLDNAIKYSGESKKVDIRLYPEGSSVILEVRDYGLGIPAGEHEKIFEKFYRAANKGGESGTGLGLYLVREILQAHGGTVELESKEGRGTIFRLVFPACENQASAANLGQAASSFSVDKTLKNETEPRA